jgi:hypothetical protein
MSRCSLLRGILCSSLSPTCRKFIFVCNLSSLIAGIPLLGESSQVLRKDVVDKADKDEKQSGCGYFFLLGKKFIFAS